MPSSKSNYWVTLQLFAVSMLLLASVATAQFMPTRSTAFVGGLNRGSSSTLRNGLVAAWYLDGNGTDSSGNGNNLTLVNTPEWNAGGILGSCFATNATPNGYCTIASNNFVQETFTVSVWLKRTGSSKDAGAIAQQGTSGKYRFNIGDTSVAERYIIQYSTNGTTIVNVFLTGKADNTWHHFVFATSGESVKIYTNGVIHLTQAINSPVYSAAANLYVGRNETSAAYFRGFIDEAYYWSRELTADEITELYSSGAAKRP